jgi:hypothetical protein
MRVRCPGLMEIDDERRMDLSVRAKTNSDLISGEVYSSTGVESGA